jgi:hypothetical protein
MHHPEIAKALGKITPRNPCPITIKNGLHK